MENEDPEAVVSAASFLESYGWFIAIGTIGLYIVWIKLRSKVASVATESRSTTDVNELEQVRRARAEKLQREYDEKARIEKQRKEEREKELEERKRLEKIQEWENLQSGKSYYGKKKVVEEPEVPSGPVVKSKGEKSLRNADWNPLTGSSGGSCSFRPARRGPASGG